MREERRIFVVLPAYNEENKIGVLIDHIAEALSSMRYVVYIIDDGSSDQTANIISQKKKTLPIEYFLHKENQGLGRTIRDGLKFASEHANAQDVIVTMDADDTHPPRFIPKMISIIDEGADVVIASRYEPGAKIIGVPVHRLWLSNGASFLFRLTYPIPGVKDYTCGYRAYRADKLKKAFEVSGENFVVERGFQCMVEILLKLRKMDVRFREIPFDLRYDLKVGASKMKVFRTVTNTFKLLLKQRFE